MDLLTPAQDDHTDCPETPKEAYGEQTGWVSAPTSAWRLLGPTVKISLQRGLRQEWKPLSEAPGWAGNPLPRAPSKSCVCAPQMSEAPWNLVDLLEARTLALGPQGSQYLENQDPPHGQMQTEKEVSTQTHSPRCAHHQLGSFHLQLEAPAMGCS